MADKREPQIGVRIRRYRQDRGMSLNQLAERSGISKGYLWNLENTETSTRPSAQTVYAIADALDVTMADLLGRKPAVQPGTHDVPDSLREFADERGLPESDVQMLASIRFRGEQPTSKQRWAFIYEAIRGSQHLDQQPDTPTD